MAVFTDVASLIPTLGERLDSGAQLAEATALMVEMTDAEIVTILRGSAEVTRLADQIRVVAAGVIAERSTRAAGHAGLAQSHGHRTPAAFVQEVSGSTKGEAARDIRVGQALLDDESESDADAQPQAGSGSDAGTAAGGPLPMDWREPLRRALSDGALTSAQFDAIGRGLGEPPVPAAVDPGLPENPASSEEPAMSEDEIAAIGRAVREAWRLAAEQLVAEARERTVEELAAAARTIRDMLDPEGAEVRFLARHEKRAFRTWRDADGVLRASIVFDTEGEAFLTTVYDAALRPRRGGPRFVDSDDVAQAKAFADDPRSNDQLAYDLLMDLLRSGVLADVQSVFGARQAGVRLVHVRDGAGDGAAPVAYTEDRLIAFPAGAVEQRLCESGVIAVTVDSCGNPLDVGRERRLFTPRQRIGLALRDGGCRWRGCDRPASYCEAHHIDEWQADAGRTDIDRGILLCRFHHMQLHHGGWRITRDGTGDFVLHHRDGERFVLERRAVLTYAWAGIDPPPKRFRAAA